MFCCEFYCYFVASLAILELLYRSLFLEVSIQYHSLMFSNFTKNETHQGLQLSKSQRTLSNWKEYFDEFSFWDFSFLIIEAAIVPWVRCGVQQLLITGTVLLEDYHHPSQMFSNELIIWKFRSSCP